MNKFMGGLTLRIIVTACFFIFYNPLEKKVPAAEIAFPETSVDSLQVQGEKIKIDSPRSAVAPLVIHTNYQLSRDSLILFARSLLGTPYLYGSADPAKGFDCSGFITYVFNHFNIVVPRSSNGFENVGAKRTLDNCRNGDVILFTGTDPQEQTIGHIGIICGSENGRPLFIHSTSGKAYGVAITSMNSKFYQDRFIGIVDILL